MKTLLKIKPLVLAILISIPLLSLNATESNPIIEEQIEPAVNQLSNLFLIPPMRADLTMSFTKNGFQLDNIDAYAEIVMKEQYIQLLPANGKVSEDLLTTITAGERGLVGNAHFFGENFLLDGVITFSDFDGVETPLEIKVTFGKNPEPLFHFYMEKMETKFEGLASIKKNLIITGKCIARSELLDAESLLNDNKVIDSNEIMENCGFIYSFNKESKQYEFKTRLNNL